MRCMGAVGHLTIRWHKPTQNGRLKEVMVKAVRTVVAYKMLVRGLRGWGDIIVPSLSPRPPHALEP